MYREEDISGVGAGALMQTDVRRPVQPRRRGRPPKVQQPEPEYVEPRVQGWKEAGVAAQVPLVVEGHN